jgi:uncharacterized protein YcbK (DUF882 family)
MAKYIAPYILKDEYACHHCDKLPSGLDVKLPAFVFHLLFTRFEEIRKQWGKPLDITSGYRCPTYQRFLWNVGQSDSPLSVHIFGLALDINVKSKNEVNTLVNIVEGIDSELRIGYQQYLNAGKTFIHIDVGYLISPVYDEALHEGARW